MDSIKYCSSFLLLALLGGNVAAQAEEVVDNKVLSGEQIVEQCNYKYPGADQRTQLTIILKNKNGNEKKKVFLRLWKDYHGEDNILEKMILFTEYPADAKGAAFMRWAYDSDAGKNADQWIYLPALRKIRRVSIRDPGDAFMGSDLTYSDISLRKLDEDQHTFLRMDKRNGEEYYVVESTPKESKPLYSKRVSWFKKAESSDGCVKNRIDYYDVKGDLLKKQFIEWQQIDKAWVWEKVDVQNVQNGHASIFTVKDVDVNVGLKDRIFKNDGRTLKRGYKR
ncbi:MAG: outer membrane lipoprotein-sorting protein [Gammaproteobacteria bacterium]|nr:outer membrane lipoprotein-sorting protein [Gammaproteobacteria bacterium]